MLTQSLRKFSFVLSILGVLEFAFAQSDIRLYLPGTRADIVYESQLRCPGGITIGPDGALYIADFLAYRIMRLSTDRKLSIVTSFPERTPDKRPGDVAFSADGTMYIATSGGIYKRTTTGQLTLFSAIIDGYISKIEFGPDGNLYYANGATNKVMLVRPDGSTEVVTSGLQRPVDVAFNPAGELFVSQFGKNVLRLNKNGSVSFFAMADYNGNDPLDITFDKEGNLFVHGNAGTLFKFDSLGNKVDFTIDGNRPEYMLGIIKANPGGIVFDKDGYLYIADAPNAKITRLSPTNHLEILVRGFNPNGLAVGPDGNIYATSSADCPLGPGELLRITPTGELKVIAQFENYAPISVASDTLGNVYVSLFGPKSRIVRVSADGKVEDYNVGNIFVGSLAATPDGKIFFSSPNWGRISLIGKDGSVTTFAQGLYPTYASAFTLAVAPDNTLYAADSKIGIVLRFPNQGLPTIVSNVPNMGNEPCAISIAPDGNIFVQTGMVPLYLFKILPDGTKTIVASDIWCDPIALAIDKNGVLYVSRSGSIDRISGLATLSSVTHTSRSMTTFTLFQNYPNPFNPSTAIRYFLPNRAIVTLTIHNTLGQTVNMLSNGQQEAGYHEVKFDGSGLAGGVYFYKIQAGSYIETKKLLLIR